MSASCGTVLIRQNQINKFLSVSPIFSAIGLGNMKSTPYFVVARKAYSHGNSEKESGSSAMSIFERLKEKLVSPKLREYGTGGLAIYSTIHFLGFVLTFTLLLFFKEPILHFLRRFLPSSFDNKNETGLGSLFLLAILINKIFGPLHLLMTVALAPKYARPVSMWCESFILNLTRRFQ